MLCSGEDGQLEALMVLRVEGWPLCVTTVWQRDENAFKYAALGGQIEMLLWMHANGCPWSEWTSEEAAKNGDPPMLQWSHENGCPWNEDTCTNVAEGGYLEVLQWARANGCQWDENEICSLARMFDRRSKIEVLEWLRLPEVLGFRAALR